MRFYIVDCFAEERYQGNQLLVVIPDREVDDREQWDIAREINFSETVFVWSERRPNGGYDARIWTPNAGEVPFAGHPSLGAAHVIHTVIQGGNGDHVLLNLPVGQIPLRVVEDGLVMRQNPPKFGAIYGRDEVADAFGIGSGDIRDDLPIQWVSTRLEAVLVPLRSREALRGIRMDGATFADYTAHHPECYCNHLFFVDEGEGRLSARCMMENLVEDPATGSANGDLAAYLLQHDYFGERDAAYTVCQGEDMGRRSILRVHVARKANEWLIGIGGRCSTVASGEWR